jgi:hypothetical protein
MDPSRDQSSNRTFFAAGTCIFSLTSFLSREGVRKRGFGACRPLNFAWDLARELPVADARIRFIPNLRTILPFSRFELEACTRRL